MKNAKKGFTLIELLIVVVIVGILALAAIPLITSNTRDARRAEGEQILGSMKGQVRVAYAKLGSSTGITKLTGAIGTGGCGVVNSERTGKYFTVPDAVTTATANFTMTATANGTSTDGTCTLTCNWGGGDGTFSWNPA